MKKRNTPSVPRHHPKILMSRLKVRISFFVWLLMVALAVFVYFHGGQFGGMTGAVVTTFDNAAPLETARLKELCVQVGDSVVKDAPLAQMDTSLLEAEKAVFEAEALALEGELAAVTTEVARLEKLLAQRLASEQDILSLRVKQKTLQAAIAASEIDKQIRLLELRIQNSTLRAQGTGIVSRIYHSPGDVVLGGDPVLSSVIEQDPMVVGFLSEHNARDVYAGMAAFLTPVSGRGAVIRAEVISLTPEVFALPGRVNPDPSRPYRGRQVLLDPEAGCTLLPGEEVQIHFRHPWTFQMFGSFLKKEAVK